VKIKAKGWQWKKDSGLEHNAFLMECVRVADFPSSGAATLRRSLPTGDTRTSYKALKELMLDCFKKVRESRNKRRRAAAREDMATEAEEANVEDPLKAGNKRVRLETSRPVVLYILNHRDQVHHLAGKWNWDVVGVKTLGVIYEPSLNDLHLKLSKGREELLEFLKSITKQTT